MAIYANVCELAELENARIELKSWKEKQVSHTPVTQSSECSDFQAFCPTDGCLKSRNIPLKAIAVASKNRNLTAPSFLKMLGLWRLWSGSTSDIRERNDEAEAIIYTVLQLHAKLFGAKDLRPCTAINEIFTKLGELSTRTINQEVTKKVLSNTKILAILPSLQQLCAKSEYLLESYWAEKIIGNNQDECEHSVYERLKSFPYFSNYAALTKMELSAINASGKDPKKIAFIGSGPLPLTSLCMGHLLRFQKPAIRHASINENADTIFVLNIDHNPTAITQSQALCRRLGTKAAGLEFLCTEAKSPAQDLSDFDVVYLAALVGSSQVEKEELLMSVVSRMSIGALLVIRSAERLRRLMYAEFDATTTRVTAHLEIVMAVHPYNHIVNSIIVGRVKCFHKNQGKT